MNINITGLSSPQHYFNMQLRGTRRWMTLAMIPFLSCLYIPLPDTCNAARLRASASYAAHSRAVLCYHSVTSCLQINHLMLPGMYLHLLFCGHCCFKLHSCITPYHASIPLTSGVSNICHIADDQVLTN